MESRHVVHFDFQQVSLFEASASIHISPDLVNSIYETVVMRCAAEAQLPGVQPGKVGHSYAAKHYHGSIIAYLRDFLISFCTEPFLREQLRNKRLVLAGLPRCRNARIEFKKPAAFDFEMTTIPITINPQWKQAHFRAPVRKNYRDLDNQVVTFLHDEQRAREQQDVSIQHNDWVGFCVTPLGAGNPLCSPVLLWLHIGQDDIDLEAKHMFSGKRVDDTFSSQALLLQEYFRSFYDKQYDFLIEVKHHVSGKAFDIDTFKHYFKLKVDKDVHRKMVEVFSFRHDISLRRETAEAALKAVLRYHPFHVPFPFVQKEAEILLEHICRNPDYYVYKSCPDFREKVQLLAQKRVREAVMMDALAGDVNITVTPDDVVGYINMLKRSRTKEFIYFMLPETRVQEREMPLSHDTVAQVCLREKTLNHVIQVLSRNVS